MDTNAFARMPIEKKLKLFTEAVDRHDVSYEYSDDGGVWRRGSEQRAAIRAMAGELPNDKVAQIWNARMDRYFIPSEAPRWYWRG
jgi:hypothetical protein